MGLNLKLDDLRKYYKVGEIVRNQHNQEFIITKVEKEKFLVRRYNWFYKLTEKIKKKYLKLKK